MFFGLYALLIACTRPADLPGGDSESGSDDDSTLDSEETTLPTCADWAAALGDSSLPSPQAPYDKHRANILSGGGGLAEFSGTYLAAWFPDTYADQPQRTVVVDLHGTGELPESDWGLWREHLASRGIGFIGPEYFTGDPPEFLDSAALFPLVEEAIDVVDSECDLGTPNLVLLGYSRGSAMTLPVIYQDRQAGARFTRAILNSGAYHPAFDEDYDELIRSLDEEGDEDAFLGTEMFLYCGELDDSHGFPMCDEMEAARIWLNGLGADVGPVWHDTDGLHGDLPRDEDAAAAALNFATAPL